MNRKQEKVRDSQTPAADRKHPEPVPDADTGKIAYQNKDITSKVLAERFQGKTFRVYGLDLPQIIKAGPTNIPAVTASELRIDNLFELADCSVAIVDYESIYKKENKIKKETTVKGIF